MKSLQSQNKSKNWGPFFDMDTLEIALKKC